MAPGHHHRPGRRLKSKPAAPVEPPFFNAVFDYIEQFIDRSHHPKEDDYLFRLLRLRSAEAAAILDRLQAEHRNGPDKLARLARQGHGRSRRGSCQAPRFATDLRNYTAGLKSHIRTEEKDGAAAGPQGLTAGGLG